MILIDENKLTNGTLKLIGQDLGFNIHMYSSFDGSLDKMVQTLQNDLKDYINEIKKQNEN